MLRNALRRWLMLFLLLGSVLCAGSVQAQRSGGSFGGGSFGGGGGGGFGGGGGGFGGGGGGFGGGGGGFGGGGGGFSGGGGWSGGSGSWSAGSQGGGSVDSSMMCLLFWAVLIVVAILLISRGRNRTSYRTNNQAQWGPLIDVSSLSLAIDWRARKHVQGELQRLAESGETSSQAGLVRLVRKVALALRRSETAWLYAGVINTHPLPPESAEAAFTRVASDARSKFRHEVVRSVDGKLVVADGSDAIATKHEGEGIVVVTLVVAAHRELLDVRDVTDAPSLRALLAQFVKLDAGSLAAMEVIWSPAEENDRMSSAELVKIYPELKKVDEKKMVGRVFCSFCGGPYAKELGKCPHCGAPNEVQRAVNPPPKLPA